MKAFLNETSLHGQYHNRNEFEASVLKINSIFRVLSKINIPSDVFRDSFIVTYVAIAGTNFQTSLNLISDKSIKQDFISIVLSKLNAIDWRESSIQSNQIMYEWNNECINDTSIAELAERKLRKRSTKCFLVNFIDSKYDNYTFLDVIKNSDKKIKLDCIKTVNELWKWIEINYQYSKYNYNMNSTNPPTDLQTFLREDKRFKDTGKTNQGRKIFYDKKTNYYFCVDNFHIGKKAHLEVFNENGNHIGESNLIGRIDRSKKGNKKIKV